MALDHRLGEFSDPTKQGVCENDDLLIGSLKDSFSTLLRALAGADVNKSAGSITSTDALAALVIAAAGTYDNLADVVPFGSPNGSATNADATYILGVAVGSETAPSVCGEADTW